MKPSVLLLLYLLLLTTMPKTTRWRKTRLVCCTTRKKRRLRRVAWTKTNQRQRRRGGRSARGGGRRRWWGKGGRTEGAGGLAGLGAGNHQASGKLETTRARPLLLLLLLLVVLGSLLMMKWKEGREGKHVRRRSTSNRHNGRRQAQTKPSPPGHGAIIGRLTWRGCTCGGWLCSWG